MEKKRGILNVSVSIFFKSILMVFSLIVRRFVIQYIGNDANGLNSLYLSIIGFLTVAELGVSEAIIFCMYKPIVNRENNKVAALYTLFRKLYFVIGGVILIFGVSIMPFLPKLANDYLSLNQNLYLTFGLTLCSVVLTYAYSAKTSLINAYKNNYITTSITSVGMLIENILKIIVILKYRSFTAYLICGIISVVIQWIVTNIIVEKKYKEVLYTNGILDVESKNQIVKNIKAMFMHKIGNVLVNTADSIVISAFIGVIVLGKYSNYTTIMNSMTGILALFFYPLTAVVGHEFIKRSKRQMEINFYLLYGINYSLGVLFCLGYYAVIEYVVVICFGANLELSRMTVFVITLNSFIQFLRTSTLMFRSSTGVFYYDRWKPLFEGIVNVLLSILFVNYYGMVGVIIATIITNLLICNIIEPYVVFKYAFGNSPIGFMVKNYLGTALFFGALVIMNYVGIQEENLLIGLLKNGLIACGISIILIGIHFLINNDMRNAIINYFLCKKLEK